MTPEETASFNANGCGCRCLIELANSLGKPITPAEFVRTFRPKYNQIWKAEGIGATSTAMLIDMATGLGICADAVARVDPVVARNLTKRLGYTGGILTTERPQAEPHLYLITNRGHNNHWLVRDPELDGTMSDLVLSDLEVHLRLGHFLLFFGQNPPRADLLR